MKEGNKMTLFTRTLIITALLFALLPASPASAQEERQPPPLEERIFTINHGDVNSIFRMIQPFKSRWGRINADRESSIIVVRDTAETIQRIEDIIERMDIAPDNLILTFFVFTATKEGEAGGGVPEDLPSNVLRGLNELRSIMAYQQFSLLDSGMLTLASSAESGDLRISGTDESDIRISFRTSYNRQSRYLRLEHLQMSLLRDNDWTRLLETEVGIEDGGVAVVGTSKLDGGEEALVAIVTMSVARGEQ
jgi:hypothetical protein